MKNLGILSILACAFLATGCIITTADDTGGDDIGDDDPVGTVSATWYPISTAESPDCNGFTAAVLHVGSFTDTYDCADLEGLAEDIPLGTYDVWVELVDGPDAIESQVTTVTIDQDLEVVDVDFINIHTSFGTGLQASWTVPQGCAETEGVSVLATLSGTTEGHDRVADCYEGEAPYAVLSELAPGSYTVDVTLLDANDEVIGEDTAGPFNETVTLDGYTVADYAITLL